MDELEEFISDKKAILLTSQKYSLKEIGVNKYDLAVTQEVRLNQIDFEER